MLAATSVTSNGETTAVCAPVTGPHRDLYRFAHQRVRRLLGTHSVGGVSVAVLPSIRSAVALSVANFASAFMTVERPDALLASR